MTEAVLQLFYRLQSEATYGIVGIREEIIFSLSIKELTSFDCGDVAEMEDAKVKNVVMSVTQTANYSGTFELLIAGSNPAIAFSGLDLPVFGNQSSHVCDIHSKTITVRTCQTRCGINDFIVARTAINW